MNARCDELRTVLVEGIEKNGRVIVGVDEAATAALPRALLERFEQATKSNLATSYLEIGSTSD